MPPVVAAIAAVATAFISTVGSVFLALGFTAGTAGFIAGTILRIGIGLAFGFAMRALSPKPPQNAIDQGQELALKFTTSYPREVIVGTAATGGSMIFAATSGVDNNYLWRVIQISDCEIDGLTEVWGNGVKLTFSGDWHAGYVPCTSHFKTAAGESRLWLRAYRGTDDQTADAELVAESVGWTSACRGRGCAYVIVKMQYDTEAFQTSEPSMFFVARGAKIYDPRSGNTVWTDTAALIAAQAMRGFTMNGIRVVGLGASFDDVPDAALGDAADDCDDTLSLAAGGTETRYRANAVISGAETAREIITDLTAAMSGRHIDRGGEVVFLPGVARTPVMAITDNDILADAPIGYADKKTADQLVNTIVSTFVDPGAAWIESALPPRKDSVAITEDGDRFVVRRAYRYVTSKTQGQRIDEIELRAARFQARATFQIPLWGIELEPGDWFTWESARFAGEKTFVVESIQLAISSDPDSPSARVQVQAAEIASSVYSWGTLNETTVTSGTVSRPVPTLTVVDWDVSPEVVSSGGNDLPELRFSWEAATDPSIELLEIEYRIVSTSFTYEARARADAGQLAVRNGVAPGANMEARARYVAGNRRGAWTAWIEVTVGALSVGSVGGVTGDTILSAIVDVNALAETILSQAVRIDETRAYLERLGLVNGIPLGTTLTTMTNAQVDGDNAIVEVIDLIGAASGDGTAFILDVDTVRVGPVESLATRLSTLSAADGTNAAAISTEATARASADSALASTITSLAATVDGNIAAISSEATARATADSALATNITSLTTTVGGHTSTLTTYGASIDGVRARQGVRLDVNGHITGYVQNNDGTTGNFDVVADVFTIRKPGAPATAVSPFVFDGSTLTIPGVRANTIEADTITATQIVAGTITSTEIATGGVVTDTIATNAATKMSAVTSAGSLSVSATWADVLSLTITTVGGGLAIDANVYNNSAASADMQITINGTPVSAVPNVSSVVGLIAFATTTSASAGTHTIAVQMQGGGSVGVRTLKVVEFRR